MMVKLQVLEGVASKEEQSTKPEKTSLLVREEKCQSVPRNVEGENEASHPDWVY